MHDLEKSTPNHSPILQEQEADNAESILFVNEPSEGLKLVYDIHQKPSLIYFGKFEQWEGRGASVTYHLKISNPDMHSWETIE